MFEFFMRLIFVVVLIAGVCGIAQAEGDLLGLPVPRDASRPGAVVLHGGGTVSDEVFERFVKLAGGKDARIILVPCAGYRPADYDSEAEFLEALEYRYSSWVELATHMRVRGFRFLYTDDPDDADKAPFVAPLETATGVWFSGGAQARLNYRFVGDFPTPTRFQAALRRVLERGGVVGGTSAGMAALPEIMTITEVRDYDSAPATVYAAHGLGLMNRAIVEQHFDARGGRLERFTGLLRDNERLDKLAGRRGAGAHMLGLAVEERTALVARGNRLEVLGSGNVHVFVKSQAGRSLTWHLLESGDTAQLKRDAASLADVRREELLLVR